MPKQQFIYVDGRQTEVVRVKDNQTGHEYTITKDNAEALKSGVKIIDKPAVDASGAPLPAKPHVANTGAAPKSKEDS